ncbi:MAG: MBL fold metallo-hydrolase, partial [Bacteroidetes bacterium]|nr:MBL fold metallo-hydrolase [Bacteroidota bacterium]
MSFSVTILGSSSAVPTKDRNQTCQLLTHSDCDYLIDAGEGVQKQLLINKARWSKLRAVFISHLHPDHYIGLIGLVCSLGLRGRTNKLVVVAPLGLEEIINIQLKNGDVHLGFELEFITTNADSELIYSDQKISVSTVKLIHRIECYGYVFTELPKP